MSATAAPTPMPSQAESVDVRRLATFLLVAFGSGWLVAFALRMRGAGLDDAVAAWLLSLMMLTPGLAAMVSLRVVGPARPLRHALGKARPGWWRYALLGWLGIPVLTLAAPFVGDLLGVFETDLTHFSGFREQVVRAGPRAAQVLDSMPIHVLVALQLVQALLLAPLVNSIFTLGEEYGWRGYLLPALRPLGQWPALVLSSVIWGLWHAPVILLGHNYPTHPVLGVLLMTAFCLVFGILFGWLRLASGSVWPAVIGHAALNGTAGATLLLGKAGAPYDSAIAGITGWTGWLLPIVVIILLAATKRLPVRGEPRPEDPAVRAMPVAIEVRGLTVRFGTTTAVDSLSLSVARGEVLALLGHNGAGKTTTIRAVNGLVEPAAGTIRVLGYEPRCDGSEVRRRVAVLTESSTLDERLTARETMSTFAALYDLPRPGLDARIESLTSLLGLAGRIDERVAGYSKGMRQRLAVARALLHDPEILYLDEPTAGLDPAATQLMHQLVRRWSRDEGKTIVLCTHNLVEAQELADRVAVLAQGRLIACDTPSELRRRVAPSAGLLIEVEAAQLDSTLLRLRARGLAATASEDGTLSVTGVGRHDVPALVADLASAGVRLFRVAPVEPSLADAYFALQSAAPENVGALTEGSR